MSEGKLAQLLTHMKRYGTINNEDIPQLVTLIEELQASEQLAWVQLDQMDETFLAWKLINEEEL
jgi:hypothetical protein